MIAQSRSLRVLSLPTSTLISPVRASSLAPCLVRRSSTSSMAWNERFPHDCGIDAEPLHRYCAGGYHPVHLGDTFSDGRYKIINKLGWGGYSTVWAARDTKSQSYVALKIAVSEPGHQNRESAVLRHLAATLSDQPGAQHVLKLQDSFSITGPNGTHECLILELLGSSVGQLFGVHYDIGRLDGGVAKRIARQALLGLSFLHEQGIAHADLHIGNLAFSIPPMEALSEEDFIKKLGPPETGEVTRKDGQLLESGVPQYLVWPTEYPVDFESSSTSIKIIDFGQAFIKNEDVGTLRTPLAVRAPEIIFGDKVDYRVDLWSMGCMLFELVAAQPPFDSMMINPAMLVKQVLESIDDGLPERWERQWNDMKATLANDERASGLQDSLSVDDLADNDYPSDLQGWLEKVYFDGEMREDLSREDIVQLGVLVKSMLRMEPSARRSAKAVMQDPWFQELEVGEAAA